MRSTNFVILVGTLGQDPKTGVSTKNGTSWANASMATSKKMKDGTYATTWHKISAFGKTAEELGSARKGDGVFIEGELETSQYEKNGQKVTSTQVIARSVMRAAKQREYDETTSFGGEEAFGADEHEAGGF